MIDIIKGLWKWIIWILLILLLGLIVLAIRIFVIDKDYDARSSNKSKSSTSSSITNNLSASKSKDTNSVGEKIINGIEGIKDATIEGYNSDSETEIDPYEVDLRILLYEGERNEASIRELLELLIENTNGNIYSRTGIIANGFAENQKVSFNGNIEQYRKNLENIKNSIIDGQYEISYEYSKFKSHITEIVITKK